MASAEPTTIAAPPSQAAGDAQFALAMRRRVCGDNAGAAAALTQAIRLSTSRLAEAYSALGVTLAELGRGKDALAACLKATQLRPDVAQAFVHLGRVALPLGESACALAAFERAVALDPRHAAAAHELGSALYTRGRLAEARASLLRAIDLDPAHSGPSRYFLAMVLIMLGEAEGLDLSRQLVRERPLSAKNHFNLATALLLHGQYEEGWQEYEWRMQVDRMRAAHPAFEQPRWQGEPLAGKPILLYTEQGFGDTLQFARYAPLVAARGGRVILEVEHHLERLMCGMPGVAQCIVRGEVRPEFSTYAPLMSLPLIFPTSASSIPAPVAPAVPAMRVQRPAKRPGFQVGIVWGGSPKHERDHLRSIPLAEWQPLSRIEGVAFTSLQRGPAVAQIAEHGGCFGFVDDRTEQWDFADTAALIAELDVVITVDTAVAHLAGTMNKPVWILLANMPDWRWGLRGDSTGWYPSARLFRQSRPGESAPLLEQVACELAAISL
jgi:Tfp pilus assembly protein PilF